MKKEIGQLQHKIGLIEDEIENRLVEIERHRFNLRWIYSELEKIKALKEKKR